MCASEGGGNAEPDACGEQGRRPAHTRRARERRDREEQEQTGERAGQSARGGQHRGEQRTPSQRGVQGPYPETDAHQVGDLADDQVGRKSHCHRDLEPGAGQSGPWRTSPRAERCGHNCAESRDRSARIRRDERVQHRVPRERLAEIPAIGPHREAVVRGRPGAELLCGPVRAPPGRSSRSPPTAAHPARCSSCPLVHVESAIATTPSNSVGKSTQGDSRRPERPAGDEDEHGLRDDAHREDRHRRGYQARTRAMSSLMTEMARAGVARSGSLHARWPSMSASRRRSSSVRSTSIPSPVASDLRCHHATHNLTPA